MQIPFNQVELSPLLFQIYVFVCPMCRCICIFEWDNCDEKKKGIELRIFYYVNFLPEPNMVELFFYLIKQ